MPSLPPALKTMVDRLKKTTEATKNRAMSIRLVSRTYAAHLRYTEAHGNVFAAGITYFSVLSLIPLLLIGLSIFGLVMSVQGTAETVAATINNAVGAQYSEITDTLLHEVLKRKSSLGIVGLVLAAWTGLGWVDNLRKGITAMWNDEDDTNFAKAKLKDAGFVLVLLLLLGSAVLCSAWFWPLALVLDAALFFWLLIFGPRTHATFSSTWKPALVGAVFFELLKRFGTIALGMVLKNPAAAVFGPVIGIMVLFYIMWRVILMCSAWAATAED